MGGGGQALCSSSRARDAPGEGQEMSDSRQAALWAAEMGKMRRRKKGPARSRL